MKNKFIPVLALLVFIFGVSSAVAEEKILNKEEAMALFKDKTFDGYQEVKEKNFKVYSAPDGKHTVVFENGKTIHRFWSIDDDGKHCVSKRKTKKGRCSVVKSMGDGVYHKITKGEHTHTLKNFRDGDQL